MKATKSKGVKEEIQEEEQDEQEDMQFIANNENLKSIFDIFAPDIKERDRAFLEETALRIEQSLMPLNALDLQRKIWRCTYKKSNRIWTICSYKTRRNKRAKIKNT